VGRAWRSTHTSSSLRSMASSFSTTSTVVSNPASSPFDLWRATSRGRLRLEQANSGKYPTFACYSCLKLPPFRLQNPIVVVSHFVVNNHIFVVKSPMCLSKQFNSWVDNMFVCLSVSIVYFIGLIHCSLSLGPCAIYHAEEDLYWTLAHRKNVPLKRPLFATVVISDFTYGHVGSPSRGQGPQKTKKKN
jgi:hypothetical protein